MPQSFCRIQRVVSGSCFNSVGIAPMRRANPWCAHQAVPAVRLGLVEGRVGLMEPIFDIRHLPVCLSGTKAYRAAQARRLLLRHSVQQLERLLLPQQVSRLAALERAADEAGIALDVAPMGPASFETGSAMAEELMRRPLPTVVICFNDLTALGVTARLLQLGVRVPEQISVAGWGGTKVAGYTTPALTTLSAPLAQLGSAAVEQLVLSHGDHPGAVVPSVTLQVTLAARATTGRAREV